MSVDFLDSNVVIYGLDSAFPKKNATARKLLGKALASGSGLISFQVVQETLNTVTRKFKAKVTAADAHSLLEHLLIPLMKVSPSAGLYREALRLSVRYQFSFYDALIVASALSVNCDRLLSEDLQHGQNVEGLLIVNPFL
jgi:predicted nucleic acid-binding protein